MTTTATARLQVSGLKKAFGGVQALAGASLTARGGEILALMGENGSGKSTLVNILAGRLRADAGEVQLEQRPVSIRSPREALGLGVALVSQELQLVPALSVAENIFLGQWPASRTGVAWRQMQERAAELLAKLRVEIDPRRPLGELSLGTRSITTFPAGISTAR